MYADDRQIVRNIRMTPLKPNKLMFWNLKLVLHTTTMSQWISFKKVHDMSSQRMCFLYLQPNIGEPLACWWFIHAAATRLRGPFQIQLFPNRKLDMFCDPDSAKGRGGHFRAFGVLIDFHTSLVIKSCVRFLTFTGFFWKTFYDLDKWAIDLLLCICAINLSGDGFFCCCCCFFHFPLPCAGTPKPISSSLHLLTFTGEQMGIVDGSVKPEAAKEMGFF